MTTSAKASAVPVMVGVLFAVAPEASVKAGADGATVSMVRVIAVEAAEALPAASQAVAVITAAPSARAWSGVKENWPFWSAVAVPRTLPLLLSVTVEPGSAVPVMVGVLSPIEPETVLRRGTAGGIVSMVPVTAGEAAETLPAVSRAVAVIEIAPFASGVPGVNAKVPSPFATVLPISTPLTEIRTTDPGSDEPVMVGVVSLVGRSRSTDGTSGGVRSTSSSTTFDGRETLPATSRAVAWRESVPSTSGLSGVTTKLPLASASAVPMTMVPAAAVTVTVEPASAPLPRMTADGSLVGTTKAARVGAPGGVRSISTSSVAVATAPGRSVSVATTVRVCGPSGMAVCTAMLNRPSAPAVPVPISVPPRLIVIVSPAVAEPLMVGVARLVGGR